MKSKYSNSCVNTKLFDVGEEAPISPSKPAATIFQELYVMNDETVILAGFVVLVSFIANFKVRGNLTLTDYYSDFIYNTI